MKTWILAAVMMIGLTVSAQLRGERQEPLKPEQRTELQAKRMTLALDLNDKQQKEVQKLLLDENKKAEQFRAQRKADRAAGKKMTADERFAMKSRHLDGKIAVKSEMKKILSAEQFDKWEKMRKSGRRTIANKHKNFKKEHKR